jgi:uncharacterized protein involved in type VI secretion and phage assembly
VNDEVLVAFEHGDINRPYVLGGVWNGEDKPQLANDKALANGKVHQRAFTTRAGHQIVFTDDAEASIILETAKGHRLTLADEKKQIILETSGGQTLTLDDSKNEVTLKSTAKLIVEGSSELNLKSGGNLSIEATGQLQIKGSTFSLKADGMGEVSSSGILEVKGSLVKIN